jgi:integrase
VPWRSPRESRCDALVPDWRLIIALIRYAGLRFPSEIRGLRWRDVDFSRGVITVRAPKTKRHGKGIRRVPIFAPLRPYLWERFQDVQGLAMPFDQHVITRHDQAAPYLRRQFEAILKLARVDQWERLFQNLRSSCAKHQWRWA